MTMTMTKNPCLPNGGTHKLQQTTTTTTTTTISTSPKQMLVLEALRNSLEALFATLCRANIRAHLSSARMSIRKC